MPFAIEVTVENLPYINHIADLVHMNLSYLADEIDYAAPQRVMLVKDGTIQDNNITFTTMWKSEFDENWKADTEPNSTKFYRIREV